MKKIKLKIVPKPDETTTVYVKGDPLNREPYIKSDGRYKLVCGFCEFVIAEKVEFTQVQGAVFECPRCKKYNISNSPIQ